MSCIRSAQLAGCSLYIIEGAGLKKSGLADITTREKSFQTRLNGGNYCILMTDYKDRYLSLEYHALMNQAQSEQQCEQ